MSNSLFMVNFRSAVQGLNRTIPGDFPQPAAVKFYPIIFIEEKYGTAMQHIGFQEILNILPRGNTNG